MLRRGLISACSSHASWLHMGCTCTAFWIAVFLQVGRARSGAAARAAGSRAAALVPGQKATRCMSWESGQRTGAPRAGPQTHPRPGAGAPRTEAPRGRWSARTAPVAGLHRHTHMLHAQAETAWAPVARASPSARRSPRCAQMSSDPWGGRRCGCRHRCSRLSLAAPQGGTRILAQRTRRYGQRPQFAALASQSYEEDCRKNQPHAFLRTELPSSSTTAAPGMQRALSGQTRLSSARRARPSAWRRTGTALRHAARCFAQRAHCLAQRAPAAPESSCALSC